MQCNALLKERITKMSSFKRHNEPAKPSTKGWAQAGKYGQTEKTKTQFYSGLEIHDCVTLISVGKKLSSIFYSDT